MGRPVGIVILFCLLAQAATTFDLSADFSLRNNPNQAWQYGYSETNSLDPAQFRIDKSTGALGLWHPSVSDRPGPVGSLFAAWAADRAKETALRLALGSGRGLVLRQMLMTAVLVSLAGGALGLTGGVAILHLLSAWQPIPDIPINVPVNPDARTYVVALVLALGSGLLFGIAPLRQVMRADPWQVIRTGAAGVDGRMRFAVRDVLLAVQIAICAVLVTSSLVAVIWAVRVGGVRFNWGFDLSEYYDLLGQAFAAGHLYFPIQPLPRLLAQPNPWDPDVDQSLKLNDAVLFNRRYYLYFGAAPAVLLFTPWRLMTGHDLPQNFAVFLLAFGGFLFACGSLLRLLDLVGVRPGWFVLALLVFGLGVCQGVPYLLNRPDVYEVAIACGYFTTSAGVFFLAQGVSSRRAAWWLAASGLMFGLAVASRPHLVFTGLIAAISLATLFAQRKGFAGGLRSHPFLAFCLAYMVLGAAVAAYNYARFGSPLEFGLKYHLSGTIDRSSRFRSTSGRGRRSSPSSHSRSKA